MGLAGTGTIRQNHLKKVPITTKEIDKKTVDMGFSKLGRITRGSSWPPTSSPELPPPLASGSEGPRGPTSRSPSPT
jgi:hypothetical protein